MKRLLSVLFWSIIAAAFIGPGTVTTAAKSGAQFGYLLLWALLFSTIATLILQEASARLTVVSGLNLGQAIRQRFHDQAKGWLVLVLVVGAIIFGCAAYEAGNILGAVKGIALGTGLPARLSTLVIAALAGTILWLGTTRTVAYVLSTVVAFMGLAFLVTAYSLKPALGPLLRGSFWPVLPAGSGLLVLGLIGTTVVPYNLFLGSGIATGQKLSELRFGLAVAVVLGGIISMAVLVVGVSVAGEFTFEAVSAVLARQLGGWAGPLFAFGLGAAGLSSAITAPLAAAITARSLFEKPGERGWSERGWNYRGVWLGVLLVGVFFGVSDVQPIPAIILAQALNGIVLPFAAVFLLIVVNDRALMGDRQLNGPIMNLLTTLVVAVTIVLGASNVLKAGAATLGSNAPGEQAILLTAGLMALALAFPIGKAIFHRRK